MCAGLEQRTERKKEKERKKKKKVGRMKGVFFNDLEHSWLHKHHTIPEELLVSQRVLEKWT